jgi:hypothetical protein
MLVSDVMSMYLLRGMTLVAVTVCGAGLGQRVLNPTYIIALALGFAILSCFASRSVFRTTDLACKPLEGF